MPDPGSVVRVAAVGDLHCTKLRTGSFRALFAAAAAQADILVLCGDLTDYGLPEEAEILIKEMAGGAKLPTIAVLGNHDFESGRQAEVKQMLVDAGVLVLDGDAVEVQGHRLRRGQGLRRRLRPGHARSLGRAGRQGRSSRRRLTRR